MRWKRLTIGAAMATLAVILFATHETLEAIVLLVIAGLWVAGDLLYMRSLRRRPGDEPRHPAPPEPRDSSEDRWPNRR
jgi:hypothetical protein